MVWNHLVLNVKLNLIILRIRSNLVCCNYKTNNGRRAKNREKLKSNYIVD